jgi:hypothetical protein
VFSSSRVAPGCCFQKTLKGGKLNLDSNPCFWSAVTITFGAVAVFFAALGSFTRAAYLSGFAAGFTAARERFRKVIRRANAEKLFKEFEDEIDAAERSDGAP